MSRGRRPIVIDLFAGAGGMSLGFEQAGFDVVAAVEVDPIHAAVHAYNFPDCAVIAKSVVGLSGEEIRAAGNVGRRPIDLVVGGAPCQGFSLIGHRILDDPRNRLVKEFVRIVAELEARYFVFENVKGLTVGPHKQFLAEVIAAFEDVGYRISKPWRVLNARHFGVPQDRQRLILVGARKGLALPAYPSGQLDEVCVADALADLPNVEDYEQLWTSDSVLVEEWLEPATEYAKEMRCRSNDCWHFGYPRIWASAVLTSSARTEHTQISRRRFGQTPAGSVEPISRFFKLAPCGVSNTLRAGTDSARGAFTSPRPIHYEHPRCITVREMARLHGFPDWFRLHVTKWHGARQIGNAVAPPLARAIGEEVLRAARQSPERVDTAIALGDPSLLSMDMRAASEHFGVPAPIGRRDRKSGARKRKQSEIEAAYAGDVSLHAYGSGGRSGTTS